MMEFGGKEAFVMFVEITLCASSGDFMRAVKLAQSEIQDCIDTVCLSKNHVFIKQIRLNSTNPIIDM